ncbi:carbohydrate ABC transporter permease [Flexilinea flocculi]|jgi:multiple sugar transport system permease protein|uniref:Carbohydrate ABC transporter membrane protein 1, CUT1 family n=1 Tax=Flexilinea flocculi TaxID=1678840 RepID=A0A0S7BU29_9CHLR|nr:sugar ABC transporter permease [Flexilinea flocculi]NMB94612.1 sugar ABC transporter permease [Flexilinea flocculi]GAP41025.1 carbohydrate ABC transporter membrane protein 1, CUT1 family [Flexilinea flocculi]
MSYKQIKGSYSFLTIPMILIMGMVIGWPLIQTFIFSFTDADLLGITKPGFTGLNNFLDAFQNRGFLNSLKVSGIFAVVVVSVEVILGTSVALLLNQPLIGSKVVRVFLILPWAVPTIVNAIMWRLIYNPEYGALNSLLYQLGFIDKYISWLSSADKALWAIIFADIWKNFSLVTLIVLASLQSLPESQVEAAKIDGANSWQRFFYITMPHIIPSLQVAMVLRIIEAVKVFDIIYVMTKGGPANKTRTGSIFIYQEAFTNSRIGAGSSFAIIMVAFIILLILVYMRTLSQQKR